MRRVLITGASSGIGKQLAQDYAAEGWEVIACGRDGEKLIAIAAASPLIIPLRFDITDLSETRQALQDVQADLLNALNTRIVVPLMPVSAAPQPAGRLNPRFQIGDVPHLMVTQFLAAVPRAVLGRPVTNLADHDAEIMAALDMALVGF